MSLYGQHIPDCKLICCFWCCTYAFSGKSTSSETDHQTEIYIADVARTVGHIVLLRTWLTETPQHMRLKYNLIHFISTMSYIQILILNVNKDLNQAYNVHWKTILYNCDFHYIRYFSECRLKTGSVYTTKYEVPEKGLQNVFLTMRTGTLTHAPFLYIHIYKACLKGSVNGIRKQTKQKIQTK